MNEMTEEQQLERAINYCIVKHEGQVRKYTGEPYSNHPIEVMNIVRDNICASNCTLEILQAALFHDLIEDTNVTFEDIRQKFGLEVALIVLDLTDPSKPSDGNRAQRKQIDLEHTASGSYQAKSVKLADLISNTRSIVEYDKNFARVYLAEKAKLLEVLKSAADPALWDLAYKTMQEAELKLIKDHLK